MREVREGDVIEIKFIAPNYINKKILIIVAILIKHAFLT